MGKVLKLVVLVTVVVAVIGVGVIVAMVSPLGLGLTRAASAPNEPVVTFTVASQPANVVPQGQVEVWQAQFPDEKGLLVMRVLKESAAAKAGVVRGDILMTLDGKEVNHCGDVFAILENKKVGDTVSLTVQHGDDKRNLTATLTSREGHPDLGVEPCNPWISARPFTMDATATVHAFPVDLSQSRITEVVPNSPADKAGLKAGETITAVNGEKLGVGKALADMVQALKPGDGVTLTVKDGQGTERQVQVTLGDNPAKTGQAYLGVKYAAISITMGHAAPFQIMPAPQLVPAPGVEGLMPIEPKLGTTQGAVVTKVEAGSPAEKAGLAEGDYVTTIDGQAVASPRALTEAVAARKPGDKVKLTVGRRGEAEREVEVTLGENPNQAGQAYLGLEAGGFFRIERKDGPGEAGTESREFQFEFGAPLPHFTLPAEKQLVPQQLAPIPFKPPFENAQPSTGPGKTEA